MATSPRKKAQPEPSGLRIGELAKRTGCPVETIRFYEARGLLPPPARLSSNYRLYERHHEERLAFILRCRSLDMSLGEIRSLLSVLDEPDADCREVNEVVETHLAQVRRRMEQLAALEKELLTLRRMCRTGQTKDCGILRKLIAKPVRLKLAAKATKRG